MRYNRPKKKALGVVLLFVLGASVYTGTFMYLGLIQPLDGIAEKQRPAQGFIKSRSDGISRSLREEMPVNKHLLNLEISESLPNQTKYERSTLLGTIIRSVVQNDKLSNQPLLKPLTKQRRLENKDQYETLANDFLEGSAHHVVHGQRDLKGDPKEDGYFPRDIACPYMGLRKSPYLKVKASKPEINKQCVSRKPTEEECERAARLYEFSAMPLSCREEPEKELCHVVETWRPAPDSRLRARCQLWPCGTNPVYVSSMNPVNGVLEDEENWRAFNTTQSLQKGLPEIIKRNSRSGFQFCFLHCLKRDGKKIIKNILTFPPLFTKPKKKPDPVLFNINVVVLDSVSRRHFYRSLSETVATLRDLFYDKSTKAAILDFELLQSLAAHTFPNIQAFMSGQDSFHSKRHARQDYGIGTLFGQMKKLGFYTLLQTDECWLDIWGSIFTNNILRHNKNHEELRSLWRAQTKERAKSNFVDDYGMSYSSCEVFKQYNVSSQYGKNTRKVCFNGRVFPQYFFDYTAKVLKASRTVGGKMPTFSYSHLSIGHEPTGTRIRQLDRGLAAFLRKMAGEEDTLTVVFSDHGPKTTPYSFSSVEGRYEMYDSFLFMVVPEKVAKKLGQQRMHALVTNQHRLFSLAELHNAFMSIGDPHNGANSRTFREVGVFAVIPERSCAEIQMQRGALCKCQGWETWLPDNDPRFLWLAEFALGQVNNLIQHEYTKNRELGSGGFGKCQRLTGIKFVKIHRTRERNNFLLSMDIVVRPLKQVFEVQVKYPIDLHTIQDQRKPKKIANLVELTYRRRVSIFRRFSMCADDGVDVRLCVCDYTSHNGNRKKPDKKRLWIGTNSQTDVAEIIRRANSFGGTTEIKNLHEDCLLLLIRNHDERSARAYEVANSCNDRSYVVHVLSRSGTRHVFQSSALPFSITVLQRTIHFLFSVYIVDERSSDFSPVIKFNTIKLRS